MKIIDFTHIIENEMTSYCEDEKVSIEKLTDIDVNKYESRKIILFTHTGTHIDSPRHMQKHGKYINEYTIEELTGECLIINAENTTTEIPKSILEQYKDKLNKVDFVFINTGYYKYWNTDKYLLNYPTLTIDAANYLTSFNIKIVGIDCISIGKDFNEIDMHKIFMEKDILIIENLNFKESIECVFKAMVVPLHIKDSDGAPVRVLGFIN